MVSRELLINGIWPRRVLRGGAALLFVVAGAWHFVEPALYVRIVPPSLPMPLFLVCASGAAEIIGGISLLIRRLRIVATYGLIALLIAVFPANIYMALHPDRFVDLHLSGWMLWARLPLQALLIAWVWRVRK